MSSIQPPAQTLWWKQPLDRVEGTWIAIALVWSLIMFAMMPLWHVYGKQNLSNEAYRTTPEAYMAKTMAMINAHTVRTETDQQIPVVAPPPGSSSTAGVPMPSNPEMGAFWSAMGPALSNITSGTQDVKPALDDAAKRILGQ